MLGLLTKFPPTRVTLDTGARRDGGSERAQRGCARAEARGDRDETEHSPRDAAGRTSARTSARTTERTSERTSGTY